MRRRLWGGGGACGVSRARDWEEEEEEGMKGEQTKEDAGVPAPPYGYKGSPPVPSPRQKEDRRLVPKAGEEEEAGGGVSLPSAEKEAE